MAAIFESTLLPLSIAFMVPMKRVWKNLGRHFLWKADKMYRLYCLPVFAIVSLPCGIMRNNGVPGGAKKWIGMSGPGY